MTNTPRIELTDGLKARIYAFNQTPTHCTVSTAAGVISYLAQPFVVFRMNDCNWWMAQSLSEAKRDHLAYYDYCGRDVPDHEDAAELTPEEMQTTCFVDDDTDPRTRRTFAEELKRRVAHLPESALFASTEY